MDDLGNIITEPIYEFDKVDLNDNGWFYVRNNNKFGLMDSNGKLLFKPKYDNVFIFDKDVLFAEKGKWGIVDSNGDFIAKPQFDWLAYNWL